jgi:hypothetical protein
LKVKPVEATRFEKFNQTPCGRQTRSHRGADTGCSQNGRR